VTVLHDLFWEIVRDSSKNCLQLLPGDFAFQRCEISTKHSVGIHSVLPLYGTVWERVAVKVTKKVFKFGATDQILDLSSELSTGTASIGAFRLVSFCSSSR
jgi:hypothetical protein